MGGLHGRARAYLRCFPDRDASLVVLANCAGPLFGPPGGSALFDALLPELLNILEVAPLGEPARSGALAESALAGTYGPLTLRAGPDQTLLLDASAFGAPEHLVLRRLAGNAFAVAGDQPGGLIVAIDDDLLYIGPFAVPRTG